MKHELERKPEETTQALYASIREVLLSARHKVYSTVNSEMVQAYWNIGRLIVEHEQKGKTRAEYGKQLLQQLSERLSAEFGKGFSVRTLQQLKKFYAMFPIANTLCSQLTWSHYRLLLKVENEAARMWYMNEAIASAWSSRQLDRQISALYNESLRTA